MANGLTIVQGDITLQKVDAIVNAANSSLLGGGGVDGAIHRAAGPELVAACRPLGGCPPGEAKITPGFRLPAKFVIHTVGPIWRGGTAGEERILRNCYRNSMRVAHENGIRSIAFASISTGIYGYPMDLAADIALHELSEAMLAYPEITDVRMVAFGNSAYATYMEALDALD